MFKDLYDSLTFSEKLHLWRMRKEWTIAEAAKYFDVSFDTYSHWEKGRNSPQKQQPYKVTSNIDPATIKEYEWYRLLRRRNKIEIKELARLSGISRNWIAQSERGQVGLERLRTYWEGRF